MTLNIDSPTHVAMYGLIQEAFPHDDDLSARIDFYDTADKLERRRAKLELSSTYGKVPQS